MKDVMGRELSVGDIVVTMFDDYSTLTICQVATISKKKLGVEIVEKSSASPITQYRTKTMPIRYKFPDQVAIVVFK